MLLLWALLALGCLQCGWSKPGMRTPGCVQGGRRGEETWSGTGNLIYEVYDSGNRDTDVSSCSKRNSPPYVFPLMGIPAPMHGLASAF